MSTSALNERSMSKPLCHSSLVSVVTSDYITPLTDQDCVQFQFQWCDFNNELCARL